MKIPGIVLRNVGMFGGNAGAHVLVTSTQRTVMPSTVLQAVAEKADVPSTSADLRKWYERPPLAERKENRERMLEESVDAFITYGGVAWMVLNPNKWALAAKLMLWLGVGTAGDGGYTPGKDYTDYDSQGA